MEACTANPEWFFDPDTEQEDGVVALPMGAGQHFQNAENRYRAKLVCTQCPIRQECLVTGLHEEFGIWGGTDKTDRARLRVGLPLRRSPMSKKSKRRAEAVSLFEEGLNSREVGRVMDLPLGVVRAHLSDHIAITGTSDLNPFFGLFTETSPAAGDTALIA